MDEASMDGIDVAATMGGPEAGGRMRIGGAELVELPLPIFKGWCREGLTVLDPCGMPTS
ncbi:hypothetical protein [Streptomyces sp. HPF1205]|uniref:hypothetical protein n=1 Tax=Streptomyces sp. HPF1205 TaxID=2873262 RepID=UPI001CEC4ABD|nr:hypothetical protein [Streptomyces sp. HPF1205]